MSLITFLIGLVVLFKGSFRLGSRAVTSAQSRSIAVTLMAPLVLEICASFLIAMNNPNIVQIGADGTPSVNPDAFYSVADSIGTLELILVGAAVLIVIFILVGAARTNVAGSVPATLHSRQPTIPSAARPPDIMTVAEAAAYMRVSEKEVLGLIDQGKLGAARIGDTYRIARIAIEDFMGLA